MHKGSTRRQITKLTVEFNLLSLNNILIDLIIITSGNCWFYQTNLLSVMNSWCQVSIINLSSKFLNLSKLNTQICQKKQLKSNLSKELKEEEKERDTGVGIFAEKWDRRWVYFRLQQWHKRILKGSFLVSFFALICWNFKG